MLAYRARFLCLNEGVVFNLLIYSRCQVNVSEPLIAFRECVLSAESVIENQNTSKNQSTLPLLPPPWSEMPGLSQARAGRFRVVFGSGNVALTVRCFPLHESLIRLLEENNAKIEHVNEGLAELHHQLQTCRDDSACTGLRDTLGEAQQRKFWTELATAVKSPQNLTETEAVDAALLNEVSASTGVQQVAALRSRVLGIGSPFHATNALLLGADAGLSVWSASIPPNAKPEAGAHVGMEPSLSSSVVGEITLSENPAVFHRLWSRLHSACTAAFRMAVEAGPLMREPLHGVGYVIEKVELNSAVCNSVLTPSERTVLYESAAEKNLDASTLSINSDIESVASGSESSGSASILTGQLISELKDALHVSMLSLPVRIVEPVYKCDLQCDQSQLGNLYAVLSQRRGEVTNEDIIEGTSLFLLSAHLPVHSSFGFAQQLLKKTSGLGTAPQLSFSHWSRVDTDPFW